MHRAVIAADYKLNFNPSNAEGLNALHERIAGRMSHLINRNAGLYTKLGQSLALQASILPAPYRKALRGVFDDAPGVGWDEVKKVWREEFGNDIEQCFEEVGKEPIASASIAQVHLATLDGKKVAIKVRRDSPISTAGDLTVLADPAARDPEADDLVRWAPASCPALP